MWVCASGMSESPDGRVCSGQDGDSLAGVLFILSRRGTDLPNQRSTVCVAASVVSTSLWDVGVPGREGLFGAVTPWESSSYCQVCPKETEAGATRPESGTALCVGRPFLAFCPNSPATAHTGP